jgi:hypothetical protein
MQTNLGGRRMSSYVERLLEPLPESDRQTLRKFLRDSHSLPSFDNSPLPDLQKALPPTLQNR